MSQLDQMRAWLPTMARTGCGKPCSYWGSARALASCATTVPTLFRRRMSSRLGSGEIVIPGSTEPDHPLAICEALGTHRMTRCVSWSHVTTPTRPPFTRSNWAGTTTPGPSVVAICEGNAFRTGWQRHTVRGVFSGTLKKKLGLTLASAKEERGRVYRIGAPANP